MVLKYEELIQELQYGTEKVIHVHTYMYVCTCIYLSIYGRIHVHDYYE